jgi:hypothetical protein
VRQPAGKRLFKRVSEAAGEATVAPVRTILPEDRGKGEKDKDKEAAEEAVKKGFGKGSGRKR